MSESPHSADRAERALPPVTTPRLCLEPLVASHAAEMFVLLGDASLYEFIDDSPPASVAALAARFLKLEKRRSPDGSEAWLNWVLREPQTLRSIGYVQATLTADRVATVAYVLAREACGHGYAREAVRAMIGFLIGEFEVTAIEASIDSRNARSIALVASLGLRLVRTLPGQSVIRGERGDETIHRLDVARSPLCPVSAIAHAPPARSPRSLPWRRRYRL